MFRRLNEEGNDMRSLFYTRILSGHISNIEELQQRLRLYFEMHLNQEDSDDEESQSNPNPNFMQEKEINYKLYPFYINWKKLEANESGYYRVLTKYGYFGVAIYSIFKEIYPSLNVKNVLYNLASVVPEYLFSKEKSENVKKFINTFFEKIPDLEKIYELIKKKILLIKEVPVIFLILKIYEVYFLLNDNKKEMENLLKSMYLIMNYLTEEEYKEIYNKHYKGKISKIFKGVVKSNGKEYELPKTKQKLILHIKYVYKKISNDNNTANNNEIISINNNQ